ncbi:MAG: ribonuclease HII [Eubacteriales bacterium]|nr:ribonuclease HII [Eubacteriales bacterium]
MNEEKLQQERERLYELHRFEREAIEQGFQYIIGVDEVGRGPLCGPVVTAACILKPYQEAEQEILFLNDSKKLSEKKREAVSLDIKEKAAAYGFGISGPERIDDINILNATLEAMKDAVYECIKTYEERYKVKLDHDKIMVFVDGNKEISGLKLFQKSIVSGDANSASISAASILAKVRRDHMMIEYDDKYPGYGMAKHKGYGTKQHVEALKELGPTPIHRRSFLKKILGDVNF